MFYALIAADTDNKYHRTHGSLGWALKDKISPDWREAKTELTRAIAIRDRLNITGWRLYEANRAVCSINILKDPRPGDPTQAELIASIKNDLDTARNDSYAKPMVDQGSLSRVTQIGPLPVNAARSPFRHSSWPTQDPCDGIYTWWLRM